MMRYDDEITERAYGISSELGELETVTYRLKADSGGIWDGGTEFYEGNGSHERFKSNRYLELALRASADRSVRSAAERLNRARNEAEGVGATTLRNTVEREGQRMQEAIDKKCKKTFKENGVSENGDDIEWNKIQPVEAKHIDEETVSKAAKMLKIVEYDASEYELPEATVNASVDEVGVNRQSEVRPKEKIKEQRKRVENTVIHIENEKGKYILNGSNIKESLKRLIGFLMYNGLMWQQIVVYSDGARAIHDAVHEMLGYARVKIVLDWYHLGKRCREQLSMACRGVAIRDGVLGELMGKLWRGDVDGAVAVLGGIGGERLKDAEKVTGLVGYLERVRPYVPCYELRRQLGLRNSSNRGEKANDLVVASRQKHNGMAWSDAGSTAFASVSAAILNGELLNWTHRRDFSFSLSRIS